jgi:predicted phage gp36 major capsid-like protein
MERGASRPAGIAGAGAKPFVLFYTTKRVVSGVQDFDAIKLVKFAAS